MGAPQSQGPLKMGGARSLRFHLPWLRLRGKTPHLQGVLRGRTLRFSTEASVRARKPPPLARPGAELAGPPRPPAPRGRCSAISLIFMGVNREAPSISVLCGQLVGLE